MNNLNFLYKLILHILFFSLFLLNINAKNLNKFDKAESVSTYFSGIISLNDSRYRNSYEYLKKLDGLEDRHKSYSQSYLHSLINLNKFNEASSYAKKIDKKGVISFESNLIIGIYYLKNKKFSLAAEYFKKLEQKKFKNSAQILISEYLNKWINFKEIDYNSAKKIIKHKEPKFKNLNKIQSTFLECYYDTLETESYFKNLSSDDSQDFSRYYFFYANYLVSKKKIVQAIKIVNTSLESFPRILLLKQLKIDLSKSPQSFLQDKFDCKNLSHITAEYFYIISNVLSSQSIYSESNFYLNIAKYLNPNFTSYNNLLAENYYMIGNFKKSMEINLDLKSSGQTYNWHAIKKISSILLKQKKKEEAIKYFTNNFDKILNPDIYQLHDYADFLKTNENYKESINYYNKVLNIIDRQHFLYAKAMHGRGVAYERNNQWKEAEKDLLDSLDVKPNQAHVINYLAYSWIEQGINVEKSMKMLNQANELKKNDGYIVDSLGWAFFKLKKYADAEKYLEFAVILMPADPVISDHYGDSLWMNGKKIQARYYWNHVLNLEETEKELKEKIEKKMVSGIN